MRAFLINTSKFLIFTIFLLTIFQILISIRIHGKLLNVHDNIELTSNVNADLVFLGSSRCFAHFDPHFFDSTYKLKSVNIGVDGHSEISMAIIRLNDYLSRNNSLKFAIFSFDPFMTAESVNNKRFVFKNDFARFAFLATNKKSLVVDYFQYDWFEKYVPMYAILKYKLLPDAIFLNKPNNYIKYGYNLNDSQWDTAKNPPSIWLKEWFFKKDEIPSITAQLDSLKRLCNKNNIKLLCIQTPVYNIVKNHPDFIETKIICDKLKIPFIDANKDYINKEVKYFYNSNHLNLSGVMELNKLLKSDSTLSNFLQK